MRITAPSSGPATASRNPGRAEPVETSRPPSAPPRAAPPLRLIDSNANQFGGEQVGGGECRGERSACEYERGRAERDAWRGKRSQ
jgi:hypothetical protein